MADRVTQRETKTKPAEGDINRNEGKQKKSEPMLKEDAGTQNEDRYSQARRQGVKRERSVGWGARAGSIIWDLKGSQREVDGLQRAT